MHNIINTHCKTSDTFLTNIIDTEKLGRFPTKPNELIIYDKNGRYPIFSIKKLSTKKINN